MRKLKYKFSAKVVATSIFALAVLVLFLCGCFAVGCYAIGGYAMSGTQELVEYAEAYADFQGMNAQEEAYFLTFIKLLYDFRWWAIVLICLSFLLSVAAFVFLMCGAGHRDGSSDPTLSYLDRIPLDITFLAVSMLILLIWSYVGSELLYFAVWRPDELVFEMIVFSLLATFTALLCLHFFRTLAARVKVGHWWRNTVVYTVCRLIWIGLRWLGGFFLRFFRSISIVWRAAVCVFSVIIIFFVLAIRALYDGFAFFLLIFAAFLILACTVLAAAQMKRLREAGGKLASGDFDYKTDTSHLFWDFKKHAEDLNSTADGMSLAVEERTRSERLKAELITNVSHDIKTPLTSIVNYVSLLKTARDEETRQQYLEVLSRQAQRLKKLTEDLVEASKASTGSLPVELVPTNSTELVNQAVAEYSQRFADSRLEIVFDPPENPVTVLADGRHLWRVLDNLFSNAIKYAMPGTRIYVDIFSGAGEAVIAVKNISREKLNVSPQELMERFVQGDPSRHTEGSGLGLSIARSLTELMGGSFDIQIDGDLFKAVISLRTP